jgi:uncharacterized protein YqeY
MSVIVGDGTKSCRDKTGRDPLRSGEIVTSMPPSLRSRMQADLSAAIKSGDAIAVSVLRTTLSAVANAEAVDPAGQPVPAGLPGDVARRQLSQRDVSAIIGRELAEHRAAAQELRAEGLMARADGVDRRAAILARY